MLNLFTTNEIISDSLRPKTIMSDETLDLKKHLCLQLVQYCQVHDERSPHNIQATINKGGVYLGTTGNFQCEYKFM